jgi:hypothetical protein
MKEYDPLNGIPRYSYYLVETTQFADFEVSQQERILFTSRNKQELVDLCMNNNWACPDCNNDVSGWYTHHIEYHW